MEFLRDFHGFEQEIAALFAATFTVSEGAEEGTRIGHLAASLLEETPAQDLFSFSALQSGQPIASIFFSRLRFHREERLVFLLGPVAVSPNHQRQGVGQRLISHGLRVLAENGVEMAVTYGDPDYYGKTGFHPLDPKTVPPPLPLSMPHGWLGQSLVGETITPINGPSYCVRAFNNPAFW